MVSVLLVVFSMNRLDKPDRVAAPVVIDVDTSRH